ncbi:MAG: YfiR family protein [Desulfobacterales bacterium]|nr:YfiR family protein [Desulfobacterales bacterium]
MRDVKTISGINNRSPGGERRRCAAEKRVRPDASCPRPNIRGGVGVRLAVWLLVGALAFPTFTGPVHAASFQEYQLKAVFLYNFINFISWPDETSNEPDRPFSIGILGKDPFGSFLEKVVADETFKGRPIQLKRGDEIRELADCRILFIGKSNRGRLEAVLKSVSPRRVLTVGDFEGFIEAGGMINLIQAGQRVRIEINIQATRNAGLGVSSKLLRVAKVVD